MFDTLLGIAGPLLGGIMGGRSADKASAAQQAADAAAIEEQRRQFDLSRADLAPWRDTGGAAVMRLGQLMGLGGPSGGAGRAAAAPAGVESREAIRARLLPSFTTGGGAGGAPKEYDGGVENSIRQLLIKDRNPAIYGGAVVDEQALNRAIDEEMARQAAGRFVPGAAASGTTGYQMFGDSPLLRRFTVGDFWADPVTQLGLQFGLSEGVKGINRMAGARGMRDSGSTLKALTRFGTDYTGQRAGESYNRFVGDQTNVYNRLAGLAGTGQTAATTTAGLGANTSNNIANLLSSGGNARGAAAIAGGNAMSGAAGSISNYFANQGLLNRLNNPGGSGGSDYGTLYNLAYGRGGDYNYG